MSYFDYAIVVLIVNDRDDVAVNTVLFEVDVLVKIQVRQIRQQLLRYERPKLIARLAVDGVQVSVVGARIDNGLVSADEISIDDSSGLRVQRIAHDLAPHGRGIVVLVLDVDATCPVDQVCLRRFSSRARQAQVGIVEGTDICDRHFV